MQTKHYTSQSHTLSQTNITNPHKKQLLIMIFLVFIKRQWFATYDLKAFFFIESQEYTCYFFYIFHMYAIATDYWFYLSLALD